MGRRSKRQVEREKAKELAPLLAQARAGELPWLDKAIREAGYGDPPGAQIVVDSRTMEDGLGISRRRINQYVADGMPRRRGARGSRPAEYDVWACWRWMREQWGCTEEGDFFTNLTSYDVARALGITKQALTKWRERGAPCRKAGREVRHDLGELVKWIREQDEKRLRAELGRQAANEPDPYLEQKHRIQYKREELKLQEDLGELVRKETVWEALDALGAETNDLLQQLTKTVCKRCKKTFTAGVKRGIASIVDRLERRRAADGE